jgi:hypothetical protein
MKKGDEGLFYYHSTMRGWILLVIAQSGEWKPTRDPTTEDDKGSPVVPESAYKKIKTSRCSLDRHPNKKIKAQRNGARPHRPIYSGAKTRLRKRMGNHHGIIGHKIIPHFHLGYFFILSGIDF